MVSVLRSSPDLGLQHLSRLQPLLQQPLEKCSPIGAHSRRLTEQMTPSAVSTETQQPETATQCHSHAWASPIREIYFPSGVSSADTDPDPHALYQSGRSLEDHFDVGRLLGKGAFSHVFECTCRVTQQQYAVKCVDTRKLRPSDLVSLEREIAISSSLKHPGVCAVLDLFVDSRGTSIVQELASCGDLFERIKRRTSFSEATAAGVMRRLLQTLAYIHEQGIVHR